MVEGTDVRVFRDACVGLVDAIDALTAAARKLLEDGAEADLAKLRAAIEEFLDVRTD